MFVEYQSMIEENEILLYSCAKQDIFPKDLQAHYEAHFFKFISDKMAEKKINPTMQHSLSCLDFKELVSMKPPKPRRDVKTTKPSVGNFVKPSVEVNNNELGAEVIKYLNIKHAASDLALPVKTMVKMSSLQNVNEATANIEIGIWYTSLNKVIPSDKASITPSTNASATQLTKATVTPSISIPVHIRPPILIGSKAKTGLVRRAYKRFRKVFTFKRRST